MSVVFFKSIIIFTTEVDLGRGVCTSRSSPNAFPDPTNLLSHPLAPKMVGRPQDNLISLSVSQRGGHRDVNRRAAFCVPTLSACVQPPPANGNNIYKGWLK